eukprot:5516962-Amphidinium_carterae.1
MSCRVQQQGGNDREYEVVGECACLLTVGWSLTSCASSKALPQLRRAWPIILEEAKLRSAMLSWGLSRLTFVNRGYYGMSLGMCL